MFKHILTASLFIASPALSSPQKPILKQHVIDVLNIDLNNDGWSDRVVLYSTAQDAAVDFFIYNSNDHKMTYAGTLAEPIWSGLMAGTQPRLDHNTAGSAQVISENASIGRNRWEQTITIAEHEGSLSVIGFTYRWYDTLDLEDNGVCDVNYLSAKAKLQKSDEAVQWHELEYPILPIQNWTTDTLSTLCFD